MKSKTTIAILISTLIPFLSYADNKADAIDANKNVYGANVSDILDKITKKSSVINEPDGNPTAIANSVVTTNATATAQGAINLNSSVVDGDTYGAYGEASIAAVVEAKSLAANDSQAYGSVSASDVSANARGDTYINKNSKIAGRVYGAYTEAKFLSQITANANICSAEGVSSNPNASTIVSANASVKASSIGHVYIKNNSIIDSHVYGAYSNAHAENSAKLESFYANNVDASITTTIPLVSATAQGDIYINDNSQVMETIYGAYAVAKSITKIAANTDTCSIEDNTCLNSNNNISTTADITVQTDAIGNAHLNNNIKIDGDTYGAYAHVNVDTKGESNGSVNISSIPTFTITSTLKTDIKTNAEGNVYLNDSASVKGNVYGAYAEINHSSRGFVDGASITYPYGKFYSYNPLTMTSNVSGNLYISANSSVTGNIYGATDKTSLYLNTNAYTTSSENPNSNSILTHNTTVQGNIYLNDIATVNGEVYGANINIINNFESYTHVYTQATTQAIAKGNIYLNNNVLVSGNIYAAKVNTTSNVTSNVKLNTYAEAQGNVYLADNVRLEQNNNGLIEYNSEIWGGYSDNVTNWDYYELFRQNTLTMEANALTVKKLGNFENYKFYLNGYNQEAINNSNIALLRVTGTDSQIKNDDSIVDNNGTKVTSVNVSNAKITGVSGSTVVNSGDSIILINASGATLSQGNQVVNMSDLFANTQSENSISIGLTRKANINYVIDDINQTITAKFNNVEVRQNIVKPLAEARVAGVQNTANGAFSILNVLGDNMPGQSFTPIAALDGGVSKYRSGSSVDSRDYHLIVGSRYQMFDNLYMGLALEYGRSNYDSHNEFDSGRVEGSGHTYNVGASLFGQYTRNLNIGYAYINGGLRFGRTSTEFNSNDIVTESGNSAGYKSRVNYFGGLVSVGYLYPFNYSSSFDSSLRYFYTRLGDSSIVIDEDTINFEKSTSARIQFKEQYSYKSSDFITLYLAAIYEYEFDGSAKTNVSGIGIDAPSVKGSTGIMELGIKATPIAEYKDFSFDLNFKGYSGKRSGASVSALAKFDF